MRIVVMLALLALVWADSPPQTLSKVGSTGSQTSPDVSTKEKEKRTTAKANVTPGIKYALPHQQAPSLPAQVHAQYIPQQQQQQQQQLLQQQQQVYSTIPQNYLQQSYQPQYNFQYLTPQTHIPQQQAYIAPQQQQVRYQFVPKGQAAEVASNQIAATQQQQQYILPQQHQQQALAFAQPQTYLLPQAHPQQYFSGGFGGYLLPGHQQQVQPIIMLAIPAQQYDAGLLGLYQGGAGAHQGRSLQLLSGGGGAGYQQQYIIPQHQQQLVQQQLAYLLNQQQPQQQQQPAAAASLAAAAAQNPHYSQRSTAGQASGGSVQLRQQQQYKS